MTLSNCRRCGTLFTRIALEICQKCYQAEEEQMHVIRVFLRKNPNSSMTDIIQHIDIDHDLLEEWASDNKIQVADDKDSSGLCKECGKKIAPGEKLCRSCMYKKLSSSSREPVFAVKNGRKGMFSKHNR